MADETPRAGIYLDEPHENAPDFVKKCISINLPTLKECVAFAEKEGLISEKGYLRFDVKESKEGKIYVALNTFKAKKQESDDPF